MRIAVVTMEIDLSDPPTRAEADQLQRRLRRMDAVEPLIDRAKRDLTATARRTAVLDGGPLLLRKGFSYRHEDVPGDDWSDRRAVPRTQRPPATRLMSSNGSALRLELTMLAVAQLRHAEQVKAGNKLKGDLPLRGGSSQEFGWEDLVVTAAQDSKGSDEYYVSRDKRWRSLKSGLKAMDRAGLLALGEDSAGRDVFSRFTLLDERGRDALGESEPYRVPTLGRDVMRMPIGLVLNGWVHVLEDSELAVLLMARCGEGGFVDEGRIAIPGEVRVRRYAIQRDRYSVAMKTLAWLNLLDVYRIGRHDDGRAEDNDQRLNRLKVLDEPFSRPAVPEVRSTFEKQLKRGGWS